MKCFKRILILGMLIVTLIFAFIDVSYAIYFAVLTNTLINIFWTANIFASSNKKNESNKPFGFADSKLLNEKKKEKAVLRRPLL